MKFTPNKQNSGKQTHSHISPHKDKTPKAKSLTAATPKSALKNVHVTPKAASKVEANTPKANNKTPKQKNGKNQIKKNESPAEHAVMEKSIDKPQKKNMKKEVKHKPTTQIEESTPRITKLSITLHGKQNLDYRESVKTILDTVSGRMVNTRQLTFDYEDLSKAEADHQKIGSLKLNCEVHSQLALFKFDPMRRVLYVGRGRVGQTEKIRNIYGATSVKEIKSTYGMVELVFSSVAEALQADKIQYKNRTGVNHLNPFRTLIPRDGDKQPAKKMKLEDGKASTKKASKEEKSVVEHKVKGNTNKRKVEEDDDDDEDMESEEDEDDEGEEEEDGDEEEEDDDDEGQNGAGGQEESEEDDEESDEDEEDDDDE